jgi:hypothetical protein
MSVSNSASRLNKSGNVRRDGWTPERQLRFLDALARTRCVSHAATSAGMSREGAYRFRNRCDGALFAALWDRILAPGTLSGEVHIEALGDGRIMRLLGNHYRRKRGDFLNIGSAEAKVRAR